MGHIEGKRSKVKQQIIYLMTLCIWMAEQGGRDTANGKKIAWSDKGYIVVEERLNWQHSDGR